MAEMIKISSESMKTVRRLIAELTSADLLRSLPPSASESTRIARKAGRPIKAFRFELNCRYAWCGYVEHAFGYWAVAGDESENRGT
jgi:hypothetical protein